MFAFVNTTGWFRRGFGVGGTGTLCSNLFFFFENINLFCATHWMFNAWTATISTTTNRIKHLQTQSSVSDKTEHTFSATHWISFWKCCEAWKKLHNNFTVMSLLVHFSNQLGWQLAQLFWFWKVLVLTTLLP